MLSAKDNFIARISNFEKIVLPADPIDSVLISKALTEIEHNAKVKMLRNGMAIIGYTILEDFIKKRIGEIFKEIGKTNVSFGALPIKLQEAATISALKGVQNRADNLKRVSEDYVGFIQDETWCISSTKDAVYEISEYSLGWDKSNISAEDLKNYFSVFNIKDGWRAIQEISSAINISLTNPGEIFKNATQRRHKAAHSTDAESLLTDLQDFVSQSKVIAFGIDALLSKSLQHIKDRNENFLNEILKTEFNQLSFRFLIEDKGKWKEFRHNFLRGYRVKPKYEELASQAQFRSVKYGEILVIKAENNQLKNWYIS